MRRLYKIALVFCIFASLTGCGMTFVYNNLAMITPWFVDDYISLNAAQKKAYQQHLATIHDWHRQHELPEYRRILFEINNDLAGDELNKEGLGRHLNQIRHRWEVLIDKATPAITDMAKTLSDEQIDDLQKKLETANQERLEDEQDLTLKQRQRRLSRNIRDWMGKLSDQQQQLVDEFAQRDDDRVELTVSAHRAFQQALIRLLALRGESDFVGDFAVLLANPLDSEPGRSLTNYRLVSLQQRIDLYAKLWGMATDKQRRKVRAKVQDYIDDFDALIKQ